MAIKTGKAVGTQDTSAVVSPKPQNITAPVSLAEARIGGGVSPSSAPIHPEPEEILASVPDPAIPPTLASEVEVIPVVDTVLTRNGVYLPDQIAVGEHIAENSWPHPLTYLPRPQLRPVLAKLHQALNSHSEIAPHLVVNAETALKCTNSQLTGELNKLIVFSYSFDQSLSTGFIISAIAEVMRDQGLAVFADTQQKIFAVDTNLGLLMLRAAPFEEQVDHKRFFGMNHRTNSRRFETTALESLGVVERLGTQALALSMSRGDDDPEVIALKRFTTDTPNIWRKSERELVRRGSSLFN